MRDLLLPHLVLASRSPRRAEILAVVGWPFEVVVAGVDESRNNHEDAIAYVERLAESKARAVAVKLPDRLVLGADTTVVVNNQILGQPIDAEDAKRMLTLLNDRWHDVITGVAIISSGREMTCLVRHERTRVRFAKMSDQQIDWYIATGEPMDKAGAYAVQGKAGLFIEEIQGDYFNVVGLPIRLVYEMAIGIQRGKMSDKL
ncbi:MAG TPA: Maf family protein [Pyrinomonadaceae bacterium]